MPDTPRLPRRRRSLSAKRMHGGDAPAAAAVRQLARPRLAAGLLVALAAFAAGCGSGSSSGSAASGGSSASAPQSSSSTPSSSSTSSSTSTPSAPSSKPAQPKHHVVKVEKVEITSPAVTQSTLAATYTCDGGDTSLPLHIGGIPPGTKELMLDLLNLEPVNGKLFFNWAVTGLSPHLHSIAAGKLPAGAVVGTNSNGQTKYSLCPPTKGKSEPYVAVLFALPHRLPASNGFNAMALRLQALQDAQYEGFLQFSYQRR